MKLATVFAFFYFLFAFIFAFVTQLAHGQELEPGWHLKFGPSISSTSIKAPGRAATTFQAIGTGFHSQIAYSWSNWEFAFRGNGLLTSLRRIHLQAAGSTIEGNFFFRRYALGPTILYHVGEHLGKNWPLGIFTGGLSSLQSFKGRSIGVFGGRYQTHQKVTIESLGFIAGLEWRERPPLYFFGHPFTLELSYQYLRGRKVSVVGGTHTTVQTLSVEKASQSWKEHDLILGLGTTFF